MQQGHRLFRQSAARLSMRIRGTISQKRALAVAIAALNAEVTLLRMDLAAAASIPARQSNRPLPE